MERRRFPAGGHLCHGKWFRGNCWREMNSNASQELGRAEITKVSFFMFGLDPVSAKDSK